MPRSKKNRFSYFIVFLYQIHNLKILILRISILCGIVDVIHFFHELPLNTVELNIFFDHPVTVYILCYNRLSVRFCCPVFIYAKDIIVCRIVPAQSKTTFSHPWGHRKPTCLYIGLAGAVSNFGRCKNKMLFGEW
jgi:hypothetical protein